MDQGILNGVRIVDLAEGRAGSLAALMLAESGADVVKVLDPAHAQRVAAADDAFWNRSKARVTLDLDLAADRSRFDALLAGADMLVHDFTPQKAAALALDDATRWSPCPRMTRWRSLRRVFAMSRKRCATMARISCAFRSVACTPRILSPPVC